MIDRVTLLVEFEIRSGRLEDFKAAVHALRSVVGEQEPGTLTYEWWLSEDARRGASIEVFADSDALVRHMGGDPIALRQADGRRSCGKPQGPGRAQRRGPCLDRGRRDRLLLPSRRHRAMSS